jgi:hypothetical protein
MQWLQNTLAYFTESSNYFSKKFYNTLNKITISTFSYESFIGRTWSLAILSVALIGVFVAMWMLIYVVIKMCDKTLGGSQTLGLILLFSVILLFCSVIPWLLPPNEMICATRHFLPPLALALNFAILLVKAMQLRSLVKVGLGGTIPQVSMLYIFFSLFLTLLQNKLVRLSVKSFFSGWARYYKTFNVRNLQIFVLSSCLSLTSLFSLV